MPAKYDIEQRLATDVNFHKLVSYLTFYKGLNILTREMPQMFSGDRILLRQYLRTLVQTGCLEMSDEHEDPDLTCYHVTRKIKSLAADLLNATAHREPEHREQGEIAGR